MSPGWLALSGAGLAAAALSIAAARGPGIPAWEARVFHAVNGLPDRLYGVLWPPMQAGNLVVGTFAGLAVAAVTGTAAVAVGVMLATALKLATEHVLRHEMSAYLAVRARPGTSQPGAILRGGDVPSAGPSFPSGHVLMAAAVGCVVTPSLPAWLVVAPVALILLVMVGRVYVGAHNPLDVTAGLGAGLVLGGLLAAFVA